MPNKRVFNDEHVIKMFVKVEGHKDLARAIFSTNLTDQQAQSWMEKVVEVVATKHPSYMIGQEIDVRVARVVELTKPPSLYDISHQIWAKLYGGHLINSTMLINEGALIYMVLDGYYGWYCNTHSNMEGFNGKEMTGL